MITYPSNQWLVKPPIGTPIDWTNPLSQALGLCLPFNEQAGQPLDVVSGAPLPLFGTCTWGCGTAGTWLKSDGSTGYGTGTFPGINNQAMTTVAVLFADQPSDTTYGRLIEKAASSTDWVMRVNDGSTTAVNFAASAGVNSAGALCDNTFHIVHGTLNGINVSVYSDGSNPVSTACTSGVGTMPLYLFCYHNTTSYFTHAKVAGLWIWNRALSALEIASHAANPWQVFAPPGFYGLIAPGGVTAPTTATLSGPTSGVEGVASTNFTITLDHPAQSGGVSCPITDSVSGSEITSTPVVIASGSSTGTFTITPGTTGARTITLASTTPTLTIAGSPIIYTASAPAPTTATLSGPTSGLEGTASTNFTVTLNEPAPTGGVSCSITDSVSGSEITSTPVVIATGQTTGTFTITAGATGARTITLASTTPALTIAGSPIIYTASAPAPTTATLSGPTSGLEGTASTNFTVTLNEPAQTGGVSCPITSSVGGDAITSTPVVIASGSTTGTFTVTPSTVASRNTTLGATTPSLTIAGSPIAYNATAAGATPCPAALLCGSF